MAVNTARKRRFFIISQCFTAKCVRPWGANLSKIHEFFVKSPGRHPQFRRLQRMFVGQIVRSSGTRGCLSNKFRRGYTFSHLYISNERESKTPEDQPIIQIPRKTDKQNPLPKNPNPI